MRRREANQKAQPNMVKTQPRAWATIEPAAPVQSLALMPTCPSAITFYQFLFEGTNAGSAGMSDLPPCRHQNVFYGAPN